MWGDSANLGDAIAMAGKIRKKFTDKSKFKLRRIPISLMPAGRIGSRGGKQIEAQILSVDFNARKIRVFSPTVLHQNQILSITILDTVGGAPRFFARGKVKFCKRVNLNTRVIQSKPCPYRVFIDFTFDSDAQRVETERYAEYFHSKFG